MLACKGEQSVENVLGIVKKCNVTLTVHYDLCCMMYHSKIECWRATRVQFLAFFGRYLYLGTKKRCVVASTYTKGVTYTITVSAYYCPQTNLLTKLCLESTMPTIA